MFWKTLQGVINVLGVDLRPETYFRCDAGDQEVL